MVKDVTEPMSKKFMKLNIFNQKPKNLSLMKTLNEFIY